MCQIRKEYTVSENTQNIVRAIAQLEESVKTVNKTLDDLYGIAAEKQGEEFHIAIGNTIAALDRFLLDSVHDNILAGDKKEL